MPIPITDLLKEQQIVLDITAPNESSALRTIVETFAGNAAVRDLPGFYEELIAREKIQSTVSGNGIAFPHARTDLVDDLVLAIGRSPGGIPFGESGQLAHLLFVIGTPKRLVRDYLVCIGALARVLRNPERREALMKATERREFLEILRSALAENL